MSKISRSEFLKVASRLFAAIGAITFFGPILAYLFPPRLEEIPAEPVRVGMEGEILTGESITVRYGRYPALVIRTQNGLRAYSAVCTHFSCICKWDGGLGIIACPCHDGLFNPEDGSVISGPPPEPLMSIPLQIMDGEIYLGGQG